LSWLRSTVQRSPSISRSAAVAASIVPSGLWLSTTIASDRSSLTGPSSWRITRPTCGAQL
jgi:hypothetical protein